MGKIIKCNYCGDDNFKEIGDVLQCRSCRHKVPKPKENAEIMERANKMLFESQAFDDASELFEEIIRITPDDAQAYWGNVLSRYGIEYVKDHNEKYLPTCHRTMEKSIFDDADYQMALSKADSQMSRYYEEQAQIIDKYQKKIKLIASSEEPYEVFISFKATDTYGRPTEDALLAQSLYNYLTKELRLKVFFSNVTLKDRVGEEFEPIIYAALTSAPVMVLVGTTPEYINATWVKNEWSRYLNIVSNTRSQNKSKHLIVAYKGMKPEQLPSRLSGLQGVDLAEAFAKENLCQNIARLVENLRRNNQRASSTKGEIDARVMLNEQAINLCNLGYQMLEENNYNEANKKFQKALEKKSDIALAMWGRLLASERVPNDNDLARKAVLIHELQLYKSAMRLASPEEKARFEKVAKECQEFYIKAGEERQKSYEIQQQNMEYQQELVNLKNNYLNSISNEQSTFDEKADKLFNAYFAKKLERNAAQEKKCSLETIKRKSPWTMLPYIIGALLPMVLAALTLCFRNGEYYVNFGYMAFGSYLLSFIVAIAFILCLFMSVIPAIIVSILAGGIGVFFYMVKIAELAHGNELMQVVLMYVVHEIVLLLGIVILICRLLRISIDKRLLKTYNLKIIMIEKEMQALLAELENRSIEQMSEINQRFQSNYASNIKDYKSNDYIVKNVLGRRV